MSVLLERVSMFTGRTNTMEIPLSVDEFHAGVDAWQSGTLIQNAFPTLDAGLREFIKTGVTPEEWDETFGGE
jgi:hypothetical protein